MDLVRLSLSLVVSPEVGGKELVRLGKREEGGLREVTHGTSAPTGLGIHVLNPSVLKHLLGHGGTDEPSTTGGGDETDGDGPALASALHGHGVGETKLVTPVATADGDDVELRVGEGLTDGGGNLTRALGAEADVAVAVTHNDERLKASTLTSTGLLLDGHDLHHVILKGALLGGGILGVEVIHDLGLLEGETELEDLLKGRNLAGLNKATELGSGNPLLLTTATTAATATTVATTLTATTATPLTKTTTTSATLSH